MDALEDALPLWLTPAGWLRLPTGRGSDRGLGGGIHLGSKPFRKGGFTFIPLLLVRAFLSPA